MTVEQGVPGFTLVEMAGWTTTSRMPGCVAFLASGTSSIATAISSGAISPDMTVP
jgi:hypothetical protein